MNLRFSKSEYEMNCDWLIGFVKGEPSQCKLLGHKLSLLTSEEEKLNSNAEEIAAPLWGNLDG